MNDWPVQPLRAKADVALGRQRAPQHEQGPHLVPYLRAANVSDGRLNLDDIKEMNFTPGKQLAFALRPDDVLVTEGSGSLGTVGASAAWQGEIPGTVCFQNTLLRLRPRDEQTDPRFLAWWSRATFVDGVYASIASGANIFHLTAERVRALPLHCPPPDIQRRIADFLDAETIRIDNLLAATNQQLDLLAARRIELFRTLTTGTADGGLFSSTHIPWMPTIARKWHLYKVGRSFQTGSGTTPRASDHRYFEGPNPWINTGDLRDGPVEQPAKSISDEALREYPTLRIYPSGTLMVAMYGATIGRVGITTIPACVNQACCALLPQGDLDTTYTFYWFLSHRAEIMRLGSGGGQSNISQDLIRSLKIPAPVSVAEQRTIVENCKRIEKDIAERQTLLSQRSMLLRERRQALITAAVRGEITV